MAEATIQSGVLHTYVSKRMRPDEQIYGVVDAARDLALAEAARNGADPKSSLGTLFAGPLARFLDHVAPHVVQIDPASEYLALWAEHLGRSAGILLLTEAGPTVICEHLRTLFVVAGEGGGEYSFRFYDPRVLRLYLPTCTAAEAAEFFGPLRLILVEGEQPGTMLSCTVHRNGVHMDETPLSGA